MGQQLVIKQLMVHKLVMAQLSKVVVNILMEMRLLVVHMSLVLVHIMERILVRKELVNKEHLMGLMVDVMIRERCSY